ncbi:LysE family translocator [Erythrobacter sp.]|uniref:LysE family translocator n=1 Tax=Erythrobacter sp. TaxID=1042 RepID=UPI002EC7671A|nr:LysE family translocator [Erythrobacter sp.]
MPGGLDIAGFALAVLLVELTPGPNMGWLVALTLSQGRRAGLGAIGGIALGLAANAGASVIAASWLLRRSEGLAQAMAVLGAAMMAWLAWQAWREAGESSTASTPQSPSQRHFLAGFLINLLNPKATLFFVTVMPQFVPGARPTYGEGLVLAGVSVAIATAIHLALILGAERLRGLLASSAREAAVRRVLALAMLAVGAWFLAKAFA